MRCQVFGPADLGSAIPVGERRAQPPTCENEDQGGGRGDRGAGELDIIYCC